MQEKKREETNNQKREGNKNNETNERREKKQRIKRKPRANLKQLRTYGICNHNKSRNERKR